MKILLWTIIILVLPSPIRCQDLWHTPVGGKKKLGLRHGGIIHFTLLFTKPVQLSLEIVKLLLPRFSIILQFFSLFYHLNKLEGVWIFFSSQHKLNSLARMTGRVQPSRHTACNVLEYFNTINTPLSLYLKVTVLCGHASTLLVGNFCSSGQCIPLNCSVCCTTSQGP